jgi:hypothetical protein
MKAPRPAIQALQTVEEPVRPKFTKDFSKTSNKSQKRALKETVETFGKA